MYAAAIHRPSLITPSPEDARPSCADRVLGRELSPCLPVRRQRQAGDRGVIAVVVLAVTALLGITTPPTAG
jgi:hypothetical protein